MKGKLSSMWRMAITLLMILSMVIMAVPQVAAASSNLTVTIEQGATQVDPTTTSPIIFDVVFFEAVTGFGDNASDVTLSGTAGATTAAVTGSGATYTVAVSGMTKDGTVIAAIPAGAAKAISDNDDNLASTSNDNVVTFDWCCCGSIAPSFSIPLGTPVNEQLFLDKGAGCSGEGCERHIGFSDVNSYTAGTYQYFVDCDNGECDSEGVGTVTVEDRICVEIIECPSIDGQLITVDTEFVVKAEITNNNLMESSSVTAHVDYDAADVLLLWPLESIVLGSMDPGEMDTVAWMFRCIAASGDTGFTVTTTDHTDYNPCGSDTCTAHQRTGPVLVVTLTSPCQTCVNCPNNTYQVSACVTNTGDTPLKEVDITLTKNAGNPTASFSGATKEIGDLAPGETKCVTTPWIVTPGSMPNGVGDVIFQADASGKNTWTEDDVNAIHVHSTTSQTEIIVDITCVQPLDSAGQPACDAVCPTDGAGHPSAIVSGDPVGAFDQKFTVTGMVRNCSNVQKPMKIKLDKPTNADWDGTTVSWKRVDSSGVETTGTIAHTAGVVFWPGYLCPCCKLYLTWSLICQGADAVIPTIQDLKVTATQTLLSGGQGGDVQSWYNTSCNPAHLVQEDKAHLTTSLQAFVEDCETGEFDQPVDTVRVGQVFDVEITLENSGDADAVEVMFDVSVTGPTDCAGVYEDIELGTVPGGLSASMLLSEITKFICNCEYEGPVIVLVYNVRGIDENTCEAIPAPDDVPPPCELTVDQCDFDIELINPVSSTEICAGNPFAVKARITNSGECTIEDIDVTLMWEGCGSVELLDPTYDPLIKHIVKIGPDPSHEPVVYEVSWMVKCLCPGDVSFSVCAESNVSDLPGVMHLQIKSNEAIVHQIMPPDISMEIVSPANFDTLVATSQEFAVTAVIQNNVDETAVTITDTGLLIHPDATIISGPELPITIPIRESVTVTWTVSAAHDGLYTIDAYASAMTSVCCPVFTAYSSPLLVWQYPVAHLDAEILSVTPSTTVMSGSDFDVSYRVTNTGEADATEVRVTLSVSPDGSVRPAEGDNSFTQFVGTIPGHDSTSNYDEGTFNLTCASVGNSNLTISATGFDEYGWHKKQVCQSTGNFVVEDGCFFLEPMGYIGDPQLPPDGSDISAGKFGILVGESSGMIGPFIIHSNVQVHVEGTFDVIPGTLDIMGVVIPDMPASHYEEMLEWYGCGVDAQSEEYDLPEGANKDVMVYIGVLTGPGLQEVGGSVAFGRFTIINGQIMGGELDLLYGVIPTVVVMTDGTYCSTMAQEALRAIDAKFIESASVTVKQLESGGLDLGITKSVDNANPEDGDNVVYTITVTNYGPTTASGVEVEDTLWGGAVDFVSADPTQGTYDDATGVWTVGNIVVGAKATLMITAEVNSVDEHTNTATVSCDQPDGNPLNNTDSATINSSLAIQLGEGWNFISWPLIPTNPNILPAASGVLNELVPLADNVEVVWGDFDAVGGTWKRYDPEAPSNTLTAMNDGVGFWIDMLTSGNAINIVGQEQPDPPETPRVYPVVGGGVGGYWNVIGFKSTTPKSPDVYLAGVVGKYIMIYGYDNTTGYFIVGTPAHPNLEPGNAYWIAVLQSGNIFP